MPSVDRVIKNVDKIYIVLGNEFDPIIVAEEIMEQIRAKYCRFNIPEDTVCIYYPEEHVSIVRLRDITLNRAKKRNAKKEYLLPHRLLRKLIGWVRQYETAI